jgi:hypothetical protein
MYRPKKFIRFLMRDSPTAAAGPRSSRGFDAIVSENSELRARKSVEPGQARASNARGLRSVLYRDTRSVRIQLREAIQQGTLMSYMHSTMGIRVRRFYLVAMLSYVLGLCMICLGVRQEYRRMFMLYWGDDSWGMAISAALECIMGTVAILCSFADLIIRCLVKLRLYNGRVEVGES